MLHGVKDIANALRADTGDVELKDAQFTRREHPENQRELARLRSERIEAKAQGFQRGVEDGFKHVFRHSDITLAKPTPKTPIEKLLGALNDPRQDAIDREAQNYVRAHHDTAHGEKQDLMAKNIASLKRDWGAPVREVEAKPRVDETSEQRPHKPGTRRHHGHAGSRRTARVRYDAAPESGSEITEGFDTSRVQEVTPERLVEVLFGPDTRRVRDRAIVEREIPGGGVAATGVSAKMSPLEREAAKYRAELIMRRMQSAA